MIANRHLVIYRLICRVTMAFHDRWREMERAHDPGEQDAEAEFFAWDALQRKACPGCALPDDFTHQPEDAEAAALEQRILNGSRATGASERDLLWKQLSGFKGDCDANISDESKAEPGMQSVPNGHGELGGAAVRDVPGQPAKHTSDQRETAPEKARPAMATTISHSNIQRADKAIEMAYLRGARLEIGPRGALKYNDAHLTPMERSELRDCRSIVVGRLVQVKPNHLAAAWRMCQRLTAIAYSRKVRMEKDGHSAQELALQEYRAWIDLEMRLKRRLEAHREAWLRVHNLTDPENHLAERVEGGFAKVPPPVANVARMAIEEWDLSLLKPATGWLELVAGWMEGAHFLPQPARDPLFGEEVAA